MDFPLLTYHPITGDGDFHKILRSFKENHHHSTVDFLYLAWEIYE